MKKLIFVALAALTLAACGGTPQACTDMLKSYDEFIERTDNEVLKGQFKQQRAAIEEALKTAGSTAEAQCVQANESFEQIKSKIGHAASAVESTVLDVSAE